MLQVFEDGQPVKCQPLAYWTFADCFAYLDKYSLERHPLHDQVITLYRPRGVNVDVTRCFDPRHALIMIA